MSDSDTSIDNEILKRITRRRKKSTSVTTPPVKVPLNVRTSEPVVVTPKKPKKMPSVKPPKTPRKIVQRKIVQKRKPRKITKKPEPVVEVEEKEVEEKEEEVEEEEVEEEEVEEEEEEEDDPVEDDREHKVLRKELDESRKLSEANTEAKRLRRIQLRGEIKPSPKVKKIIRRRIPKAEQPTEVNPLYTELVGLRDEISQIKNTLAKGFNNGNQYAPMAVGSPQQLSEIQSNLLRSLTGRRF